MLVTARKEVKFFTAKTPRRQGFYENTLITLLFRHMQIINGNLKFLAPWRLGGEKRV
jgi:hypothetical protein